jgi:hypothetical protein
MPSTRIAFSLAKEPEFKLHKERNFQKVLESNLYIVPDTNRLSFMKQKVDTSFVASEVIITHSRNIAFCIQRSAKVTLLSSPIHCQTTQLQTNYGPSPRFFVNVANLFDYNIVFQHPVARSCIHSVPGLSVSRATFYHNRGL